MASWLIAQSGRSVDEVETVLELRASDRQGLESVAIETEDSSATIARDMERGVITASVDGQTGGPAGVTRYGVRGLQDLIVRELKKPESDRLLLKVLPLASVLAARANAGK